MSMWAKPKSHKDYAEEVCEKRNTPALAHHGFLPRGEYRPLFKIPPPPPAQTWHPAKEPQHHKNGAPLTSFQVCDRMDGQEDPLQPERIPSSVIGQSLLQAEQTVAAASLSVDKKSERPQGALAPSYCGSARLMVPSFRGRPGSLVFPTLFRMLSASCLFYLPDIDRVDLLHIDDAITGIGQATVALETAPM